MWTVSTRAFRHELAACTERMMSAPASYGVGPTRRLHAAALGSAKAAIRRAHRVAWHSKWLRCELLLAFWNRQMRGRTACLREARRIARISSSRLISRWTVLRGTPQKL